MHAVILDGEAYFGYGGKEDALQELVDRAFVDLDEITIPAHELVFCQPPSLTEVAAAHTARCISQDPNSATEDLMIEDPPWFKEFTPGQTARLEALLLQLFEESETRAYWVIENTHHPPNPEPATHPLVIRDRYWRMGRMHGTR